MRIRGLAALISVCLAACGGSDGGDEPDPLIDGSVAGQYDGEDFTAAFGFAGIYQQPDSDAQAPIIGVGDEGLGCDSRDDADPPPGHSAVVVLDIDDFAVGEYTGLFVNIYTNVDEFEGTGTGGATLSLTEVTDTTVAGSVDWAFTDSGGRAFALSGSFEVVRCAD